MTFNEYAIEQRKTAIYSKTTPNYAYSIMGLCEEVGELVGKLKKIWRNKQNIINESDLAALTKEAGDVLWYLSELCFTLGIKLDDVAVTNINKLKDRQLRNVICSEGDDR